MARQEETLPHRKPDISHLFLYGCKAYSIIHKIPKKQKLEPRASVGYLIGYDSTNIDRIWNPQKGEVFRTRDVTFDETSLYSSSQLPLALQEQVHEAPQVLEDRILQDNEKARAAVVNPLGKKRISQRSRRLVILAAITTHLQRR